MSKNEALNRNKRYNTLFFIFFVVFLSLIIRLFYLQVYNSNKLAQKASAQRISTLNINKPRGDILDRNDISFTNVSVCNQIVFKPLLLRGNDEEIRKVCEILELDVKKIERDVETKSEPFLVECDQRQKDLIKDLGIKGISVLYSIKRLDDNSIARHIIGYLNKIDQTGEAGIEKIYQDTLEINKVNSVGAIIDARNNLVKGLGYRFMAPEVEKYKFNVKLTLDYHIQRIVETIMEKNEVKGAVVVEDVSSGDILAMASKPDFDSREIEKYLNSSSNELFNKAVAAYSLGSVFKIIDVAELFEIENFNKTINSMNVFYCSGFINVNGREFKCTSYEAGGHGFIDLNRAFSSSCNSYFINLGLKLGVKNIASMAMKFGLGSETGINEQGINESPGSVVDEYGVFMPGDIANLSIGQGNILATPIQVANMIATIANGGIKNKVNIVDSIIDESEKKIKELRNTYKSRIISEKICGKLKKLMEKVVDDGTGTKANIENYGGSAGKTGSAETGQFVAGEKVVHAWFAGYFPRKTPKYSIAVFIENGKAGGQAAAPIFSEIANEIMKIQDRH